MNFVKGRAYLSDGIIENMLRVLVDGQSSTIIAVWYTLTRWLNEVHRTINGINT